MDRFEEKLQKVIAQGCLTNSKHKSAFVQGVYPVVVEKGFKTRVVDTKGQSYIDMIAGLGALSFGYRNEVIDDAAIKAIHKSGVLHSLPTTYEIETADFLLSEFLTTYDRVKFLKTGAESTAAAIRMARVATGRLNVISHGYHGWLDSWISLKPNNKGIPPSEDLRMFDAETIQDCIDRVDTDTAAVIVEPIMLEYSDQVTQKLYELTQKCKKVGALTIFDEIVCGTRVPGYFVSRTIQPDLVCIGKGIANGYPLAAVIGKKDIMDGKYFVSSTYAGEVMSLAACLATLKELKKRDMNKYFESANEFQTKVNGHLSQINLKLEGYGTRSYIQNSDAYIEQNNIALFMQECVTRGLLTGRSWFFTHAHDDFVTKELVLSIIENSVMGIKSGSVKLKGEAPIEPFKRV